MRFAFRLPIACHVRAALLFLLVMPAAPSHAAAQERRIDAPGVLLLAHGGKDAWNAEVRRVAAEVESHYPVEIAFGMADRTAIQDAVRRLEVRGAREIIAVPLFVSSHSSVITATEYLLGLRQEAPPELAAFARMRHGASGHHGAGHGGDTADRTTPVESALPIRMTDALNRHPLVGDILLDRARGISKSPEREAVILVAHGPVKDAENERWLADMAQLAERVRSGGFARVDYLTVRDDAPEPTWSQAKAALRASVESAHAAGLDVLVVPHLLAFGGIEEGLRKRLDGLEYRTASQALLPDARLARWVIEAASASAGSTR